MILTVVSILAGLRYMDYWDKKQLEEDKAGGKPEGKFSKAARSLKAWTLPEAWKSRTRGELPEGEAHAGVNLSDKGKGPEEGKSPETKQASGGEKAPLREKRLADLVAQT